MYPGLNAKASNPTKDALLTSELYALRAALARGGGISTKDEARIRELEAYFQRAKLEAELANRLAVEEADKWDTGFEKMHNGARIQELKKLLGE